jgi:hypothetical protein
MVAGTWVGLQSNELAVRLLVRSLPLKTEDQLEVERVSYPPERVDADGVPAALDARDLRVACPDAIGQLLLCQAMLHAVLDQEPRDLAEAGTVLALRVILRATGCPAFTGDGRWGTNGANGLVVSHALNLSGLIS